MDWFLYDKDLRHERVKYFYEKAPSQTFDRVLNTSLIADTNI